MYILQGYLQCTKWLYSFGYRIPQVQSATEPGLAGEQEEFRSDLVIWNQAKDDQVIFPKIFFGLIQSLDTQYFHPTILICTGEQVFGNAGLRKASLPYPWPH